ncbi:helix-turn-helix domain-containing protein [Pseudovibrio ascidiaceicola]|uniref:helix-turn-helix domain-containing protein n=1 Tax=Pseudovibrio ascidiaceicola TaxID=285279 RepID=UPI003D3615EE
MENNPIKVAKAITGLTGDELAERLDISPGYLSRMANNKRKVTTELIESLARICDLSLGDFYSAMASPELPKKSLPKGKNTLHPQGLTHLRNTFGGAHVSVYTGKQVDNGGVVLSDNPISKIPAPGSLEGIPEAYAVYVQDNTMEPRYFEGEVVFMNPTKPPKVGDFVLLQVEQDGMQVAFIRRYVGNEPEHKVFAQYLPEPKEVRFRQSQIVYVHKIMAAGDG